MKRVLASVLALVMILVLTSCAANSNNEAAASSEAQSNEASASQVEVDKENTEESTDGEKVKVVWQTWKSADRSTLDIAQVPGLENIEVEFLTLELEDSYSKMKIDLASGGGADLCSVNGKYMFNTVEQYMLDLTPYITEDLGADWNSYFPQSCLNEIMNASGEMKAMPCGYIDEGIWLYNADTFAKYDLEEPKTYDDLVAICATIRDGGEVPAMIGASEGWILMNIALSISTQTAPGEIYKAANLEQSWNTPGLLETFRIFQNMFTDVWQDGAVTATHYGDSWDAFRAGTNAMFCGGAASLSGINTDEYSGRNWGMFFFPDVDGDGNPSTPCAGTDEQIMINAKSKVIDEAYKVAACWGYGAGYDHMLQMGCSYGYYDNKVPDTSSWEPSVADLFAELSETSLPKVEFATSLDRDDTTSLFHSALKELAAYTKTPEEAAQYLDEECSYLG